MRRKLSLLWVPALLAVGVASGCGTMNRQTARTKPPPDPLLLSKKPVEGKPASADPLLLSQHEAPPPPMPGPETTTVSGPAPPVGARLLGLQPLLQP
jgi:hypothetical protein